MKKILNFTIQHLSALLLVAGIAFAFTACSDEDDQSNAPVVEKISSTYDAASFKWTVVNGATEYAYRLVCHNDGKEVKNGTTTDTSIDFTGLTPTKTYYLYISAKVGSVQTEEGRAAAATGFKLSQPSASMKVRMTEARKVKTWLSWSTIAAEKYAYSLDGTAEVVTDKASLDLPDNFAVAEHKIAVRAITSDPLFQNSDVKIYTFTPSGNKSTGFLNSKILNIMGQQIDIEYWRIVDDIKFEDLNKYRVDTRTPILGKVFSSYPEFKKDDKTYTLIPLGVTEVKDKDNKVIGYDFGTINGLSIMVTAITVDSGFGTLSITYTYDVDRKKSDTIKVPLSAKPKAKDEL